MDYTNELIAIGGGTAAGIAIFKFGIGNMVPGGGGKKIMAAVATGAVSAVAVSYFLK